MQLVVIAADQTAPPATAAAGDLYIVATPANGAWTDQAGKVAYFMEIAGVQKGDITIVAAAIWRLDAATWTYPYPFIVTPNLFTIGPNNRNVYWSIGDVATPTTGQGTAISYVSITDRVVKLVAIGRWF